MANKKAPAAVASAAEGRNQRSSAATVGQADGAVADDDLAFLLRLAGRSFFETRGGRRRRGTRAVDVLGIAHHVAFHNNQLELQFLSQLDLYRAQAGMPALIELMHRVREHLQRAPQEIVLRWSSQVVTAAVPPHRPEASRRSVVGDLDVVPRAARPEVVRG